MSKQITRIEYEAAQAERRVVDREMTALWLKHANPAREAYEAEVRRTDLPERQRRAQSIVEEYERRHPTQRD